MNVLNKKKRVALAVLLCCVGVNLSAMDKSVPDSEKSSSGCEGGRSNEIDFSYPDPFSDDSTLKRDEFLSYLADKQEMLDKQPWIVLTEDEKRKYLEEMEKNFKLLTEEGDFRAYTRAWKALKNHRAAGSSGCKRETTSDDESTSEGGKKPPKRSKVD